MYLGVGGRGGRGWTEGDGGSNTKGDSSQEKTKEV